tara:strand:- start:121 stop:519 length:399 start_codon:yes stop_codon:yes gene_type:complete
MRLSELLVSNERKPTTGSRQIDNMLSEAFDTTVGSDLLPVSVDSSKWQTLENPRRIARNFIFASPDKQRYFINEILNYQERLNHHCKMIIDGRSVSIESHTHDLNDVTSLDLKLAKFADEIYRDTQFFLDGR